MDKKDKVHNIEIEEIYEYDIDTEISLLDTYCQKCDFVFHLAGINRPKNQEDFMKGNFGFTSVLLDTLKNHGNKSPIMLSSSIQATLDNEYGKSKKCGEELLEEYGKSNNVKTLIYRFPNVFGIWCKPNYNSVVATFCYNIANDLPITINNRETVLTLVYVGDIVEELLRALVNNENRQGLYCSVQPTYQVSLGEIADLLYSFKNARSSTSSERLALPDVKNEFCKKLYVTYTSYLPTNDITKGFHYHMYTKVEKFVVVSGTGLIRFRKIDSDEIIEYYVSSDKIKVVDIPLGYTHEITNLSKTEDLITFMWCDECFDPSKPDTYYLEVGNKNE